MTPTPAETALWRALNVEPEEQSDYWPGWSVRQIQFSFLHPADRLAYFEGKVREAGAQGLSIDDLDVTKWQAVWFSGGLGSISSASAPTEHDARFHAAARAIHALGMITDAQMKEISDGEGCN